MENLLQVLPPLPKFYSKMQMHFNITIAKRKRERSPNPDCDDCLPISKRITRLNIQANRHSVDEKVKTDGGPYQGCSSSSAAGSQEPQSQWQQSSGNQQGNNNNINYLPCGTRQCDSVLGRNGVKSGLQAYANLHGIPNEDLVGYKPELSQNENPHYYDINSVLYSVHLEKATRQGMSLKP